MGNYLDKNSRSLRRRERRPFTRTPPRQSWGRGPSPHGVAATTGPSVDVSFTACCAAPTGRVPGLRGAFIIASTPCSCVGIGDQHSGIVRLFEVVYRQCSLPSLLTYLVRGYLGKSGAWVAGYTPLAGSGKKTQAQQSLLASE